MAAEPSLLALSTTITSNDPARVWSQTERRQSRRMSRVFQLTMMTVTSRRSILSLDRSRRARASPPSGVPALENRDDAIGGLAVPERWPPRLAARLAQR